MYKENTPTPVAHEIPAKKDFAMFWVCKPTYGSQKKGKKRHFHQ